MPVIELSLTRLAEYTRGKASPEQIQEALPYLGLDIEKSDGDSISVEYNPNRPDFCSEAGIARSLLGQLGIRTGIPKYNFPKSGPLVKVASGDIVRVRPYIFCLEAKLEIDDQKLRQLIGAQEDLHNGSGRRRAVIAIGLHDATAIRPPIKYTAVSDENFAFVPLGETRSMSIRDIIRQTDQGMQYGRIVGRGPYPMLLDSQETVLSMPPIINGAPTRLKPGASSIFVDVTATDRRAGETTIAILGAMISDMGGKVTCVCIHRGASRIWTPDMEPSRMKFNLRLTNGLLGLDLSQAQARRALERSRLELASTGAARIPRFRSDILHEVDLVEEVALGHGIARFTPAQVATPLSGSFLERSKRSERIAEVLVGLGLTEIAGLMLRDSNYADAGSAQLRVEGPKSASYEYLLADVMPELLDVLAKSKGEEYPQHLFREATVFSEDEDSEAGVREENRIGVVLAESKANFTMASSILRSFTRLVIGSDEIDLSPASSFPSWYAGGRVADVHFRGTSIGLVGEISPKMLSELGLEVPVSAFEIRSEALVQSLKTA